ncbi:aspartic proteinase 39-like isoform X2 [Zingiber officinale]|uniref:aspartic proteinase 39-like isoform X2 n=1 Tax=Zingiber officinale TaxID=94328 RepID=UPI001C4AB389|nr:aspartic proteinase 39-like isoform X2 [Zingiber officinale]
MVPQYSPSSSSSSLLALLLVLLLALAPSITAVGLLKVRHKFLGRRQAIAELRTHDIHRHSRILAAVDIPIGGSGIPTDAGLYYAEIAIGTPPTNFHVQVDTGSDLLWVNCISCVECPKKSDLGFDLMLYDPKASTTSRCGAHQSGDLGTRVSLDGILGFGQSNSSMISQLAASGKSGRIFAHCLDTVNGGGIFIIGHVVEPKVKTTPLVPAQPHYNVNMKGIGVGGAFLQLPTYLFDTGDGKGTIIDSGTTMTYLPDEAYQAVMKAIFSNHPNLSFHNIQGFLCFLYSGSVDDEFPDVVFHFENSLLLNVYPHDYLFQNGDDDYCVGWQSGGTMPSDGKDMFLLGDLVLSNKLIVYDLENQVIGWTEYNCSSSIKVQEGKTATTYSVDAHNISSGRRLQLQSSTVLLLLTYLLHWIY